MFHKMNRSQVGSYYSGRGALCHAVTGNKEGAKCVLCYEREEMVTKGIISDKAITRIRTT